MSNEDPTNALRLPDRFVQLATDAAWARNVDKATAMMVDLDDLYELLLAAKAAPASPLSGGGPHERWSILNHLGESWTPENFDTERQATAYLDDWKRHNPKMDLSKHKVIPVLVTMTAAPTGDA